MSLILKIDLLENKFKELESAIMHIPEWLSLTKTLANQYGYTLDGFRNWCLTNIEPEYFKKIDNQYALHRSVLHLVNKK